LFNWLAPWIEGASCLDLFAGSGALGFEALSRGAGEAWMVESDAAAAASLEQNRQLLGAERLTIRRDIAQRFLTRETSRQFDIVFLDPPFSMQDREQVFQLLAERGWLREHALIYMESAARTTRPSPPSTWGLLRRRQAGQVDYALYRRGDAV
jgi:16S rRNA (guanine966-N2)-methyltransferase